MYEIFVGGVGWILFKHIHYITHIHLVDQLGTYLTFHDYRPRSKPQTFSAIVRTREHTSLFIQTSSYKRPLDRQYTKRG